MRISNNHRVKRFKTPIVRILDVREMLNSERRGMLNNSFAYPNAQSACTIDQQAQEIGTMK